ncbi:MAG: Gfo/Idh/MocA family oxidoreductase [Kiritimatiellae bacterium]|jgi:predicted dehydrogenase|nr:Gfo/Idh/MocA family oxidoreductase [Kiritimatiellia bacterium]
MKKIKTAIIGFGFRAQGLAQNLINNNSFNIMKICDKREERLQAAKEQLGAGLQVTTNATDVFQDNEIEAVVIAAPQFAHRDLSIRAFQSGKHVYCEKPLALSVKECDDMIAAANRAKKIFMVGQQMRYHAHLQKAAALIKAGEIGKPVMAWIREFRNPFPETMSWAFDRRKSGGMLVEKSCHHFDVFNWLMGSKPLQVFASGAADVFKKPFGLNSNIADNAYVIIDYENGGRAFLQLCMFMGLPFKCECGVGQHVREIGAAGAKGMIRTEGFDLGQNVEILPNDSRNIARINIATSGNVPTAFNQNGNDGIFVDFADCIRKGKKPFAGAAIGKTAVAVAVAAEKSMAEKRIVKIKEVMRQATP